MYLPVVLVDNNLEVFFNLLLGDLIFASGNVNRERIINSFMTK